MFLSISLGFINSNFFRKFSVPDSILISAAKKKKKKKKTTRGLKEDTKCVADRVNNNYAVRQKRMLPGTSVLNPKK